MKRFMADLDGGCLARCTPPCFPALYRVCAQPSLMRPPHCGSSDYSQAILGQVLQLTILLRHHLENLTILTSFYNLLGSANLFRPKFMGSCLEEI